MNPISEEQLSNKLVAWVRANRLNWEIEDISTETELLGSGLLDSFGFIDLIVYVEGETGRRIDLANANTNEFSAIKGLCSLALRSEMAA
jgi:acyl carrier protein